MFYWALLNVENHQKYSLTAIQLYAVVKVQKMRNEKSYSIFNNLIQLLKKLENGLIINIRGENIKYFGILALGLGDTPALNWLGGFKESVSKTIKYCRNCEISRKDNMCYYNIIPRCNKQHLRRLDLMNKSTFQRSQVLSKKYGINYKSLLLKIDHFDVCKSLVQDPMHVLFEGICHLELSCFLEEIIFKKKIFNIDFLNDRIKKFNYCFKDRSDLPNNIEKKHIDEKKFCQSAGQFSTLMQNLPLIIGENLVGNSNWENFLRLISIINLTFSFCYNDRTINELDHEIKLYLVNFSLLYNDVKLIPKMHFLCHFPKQMMEFGPLRLHSTFRFESKNGLVKSFNFNNFINICKSVANRQENWMVSKKLDSEWEKKENFLSSKGIIKKKLSFNIIDDEFRAKYHFELSTNNILNDCFSISLKGFSYKINDYIIVADNFDNRSQVFGKIKRILLANDSLVFKLEYYDITDYLSSINCFTIIRSNKLDYKYYENIIHKEPANDFFIENIIYIQVRNFFHKLA